MSDATTSQEESKAPKTDRRIKRLFLIGILVGCVGVYFYQTRSLTIDGWGDDLAAALTQAKSENRPVVALFVAKPPSATARRIHDGVIRKSGNQKALKKGNFIPVVVQVDRACKGEIATKYKIDGVPTLMVLTSDGKERNRNVGNIGEAEFRDEHFLDYKPK